MVGISTQPPGLGRQTWNFLRHFLEMCVAMCVGGGALYALFFVIGPALLGYADPRLRLPEASLLAIAVIVTIPMGLWMRFRGMEWRPIVEMSGAAIGVALALIGLALLGALSAADFREFADLSLCGPACVAMFGAMLFRLDLYTGRAGHHMARAAHAT